MEHEDVLAVTESELTDVNRNAKKSEIEGADGADGADGITELDQNAADRLEANPQNQPLNVAHSASCSSNFIIQKGFASLTKMTHISKLNTFRMMKTVQICSYS